MKITLERINQFLSRFGVLLIIGYWVPGPEPWTPSTLELMTVREYERRCEARRLEEEQKTHTRIT